MERLGEALAETLLHRLLLIFEFGLQLVELGEAARGGVGLLSIERLAGDDELIERELLLLLHVDELLFQFAPRVAGCDELIHALLLILDPPGFVGGRLRRAVGDRGLLVLDFLKLPNPLLAGRHRFGIAAVASRSHRLLDASDLPLRSEHGIGGTRPGSIAPELLIDASLLE